MNDDLEERKRKEVFRMLVDLQDSGCTVDDSYRDVVAHFGIAHTELRAIQREGLHKQWPPL